MSGGDLVAVVNTGDDLELYGLSISPDLDTITYTLAGEVNATSGWGCGGASSRDGGARRARRRPTWFGLGDRDLATHLYRTGRLAEGATLTEVTAELADGASASTSSCSR